MGSPTLRDVIHAYTFPGGSRRLRCELLKAHLIDRGFDLDATPEEVADGRALHRLPVGSCVGIDPLVVYVTSAEGCDYTGPTLAAAVAALEADDAVDA